MKMISANKLNRLWENGVVAKMVAKTKVLKTMEEISANTNSENVAGATAVKELSNKLVSDVYVGNDGKLHKVIGGADTVIPFSSSQVKVGSGTTGAHGSTTSIDIGFVPDVLSIFINGVFFITYDSLYSTEKFLKGQVISPTSVASSAIASSVTQGIKTLGSITEIGIITAWANKSYEWIAAKR